MNKRVLTAAIVGNAIEYYEFTVFVVFASAIAQYFFPSNDPFTGLMLSFSTFSLGFIARPLGGALLGYLGDRWGRKNALSLSIFGLFATVFLMTFLPTYETWGRLAPICLIALRILQGIFLGGEGPSAAIYVLEHAKESQKGFVTSLVAGSNIIGLFLAMLVGYVASIFQMESIYAWRIAMLIGTVGALTGVYIRAHLPESKIFEKNKGEQLTFKELLNSPLTSILAAIFIGGCSAGLAYTLIAFLKVYLVEQQAMAASQAQFFSLFGTTIYMGLMPLFGKLSDKFGARFILQRGLAAAVPMICLVFLGMSQSHIIFQIVSVFSLGVLCAWISGPLYAYLADLFPVRVRCFSISSFLNVGISLFGGTIPMVHIYLLKSTGGLMGSAFYIAILMATTFALITKSKKKSILA